MTEPGQLDKSLDKQFQWKLPEVSAPVLYQSGEVLDLVAHARSEANAEPSRPTEDATEPNSAEELVIGSFRSQHRKMGDLTKSYFHSLQEKFNRATRPPEKAKLENSLLEAETNVTIDLATNKHPVEEKYRELKISELSRQEFREANRLKRKARYPESKLYHFAVILVIVLLECVANMYFFAQGNELGLLGGILQAALISVANVGTAILAGYFLVRAATHVKWSIKLPAILGLIVYVAGIVAFNLLASHYRDLMSVPGEALEEAIPHMMRAPFELSFHSVLLFVTGMCASALGIYKGMSVDDTYPGYGDVDRDYKEASRAYSKIHQEVQATVLQQLDHLRDQSEGLRQQVAAKRMAMEQCINELTSLTDLYYARANDIKGECCRQLKIYRDENRKIRVGAIPAYFGVFPNFRNEEGRDIALPSASEWAQRVEEVEDDMKAVENFTDTVDKGHPDRVETAIGQFETMINEVEGIPEGAASTPPEPTTPPEDLKIVDLKEMSDEA